MARRFVKLTALATTFGGTAVTVGALTGNEFVYDKVIMPVLHQLDGETAHKLAVFACRYKLYPNLSSRAPKLPRLRTTFLDMDLENCVGLSAGFDKNAECMDAMLATNFGFVEVGSVTPLPQPGNDQPRVFRSLEHGAIINRYGFNSLGADSVEDNIKKWRAGAGKGRVLGINLGKNKAGSEADFTAGAERFASLADYLVINVSSPNTPGLRDLQRGPALRKLLKTIKSKRLLLKIAPDLSEDEKKEIASVALEGLVSGLIISNTTSARPGLSGAFGQQTGGLSGRPLRELSTALIREMRQLTKGTVPIVGLGGVASGEDAFEKIAAGASVVQLYTAMAIQGPLVVTKIQRQLDEILERSGFETVAAAVGCDNPVK